jgi:hypothetical protein
MLAKVTSCSLIGLDGAIVEIEVDNSGDHPGLICARVFHVKYEV